MKLLAAITLASTMLSMNAFGATCSLDDVAIEGVSATSCVGMNEGNVNSLEDVNNTLSTSYTDISPLIVSGNTFIVDNVYSNVFEVVLKQNTLWAIYRFDLTALDPGVDGVWSGTWSTDGMQWDGNLDTRGCQGCGGLSHGFIVGNVSEVPLPGTLGLFGIGMLGLGVLRRKIT